MLLASYQYHSYIHRDYQKEEYIVENLQNLYQKYCPFLALDMKSHRSHKGKQYPLDTIRIDYTPMYHPEVEADFLHISYTKIL